MAIRFLLSGLLTATIVAAAPGPAVAEGGPIPPCAAEGLPYPSPAPAGELPNVRVWFQDRMESWTPPVCLETWKGIGASVLVALSAEFRHAGDTDGLVARIGRVTTMADVRYWSVSEQRWRAMFSDVYPLSRPDPEARRPDFAPSEVEEGETFFFLQDESGPAGAAVVRAAIRTLEPDRLVVEVRNHTPVPFLFFDAIEAEVSESRYVFERIEGERWRYYSLIRLKKSAPFVLENEPSSYANRAVALFRWHTGQPTDREPPYAPDRTWPPEGR